MTNAVLACCMEECTLSRLHQGYTKGAPRDTRSAIPCVTSTCRMHGSDRKGICVGVYPFFPKTYAGKLYIYRGVRQGALLYVYI